MRELEKFLYSIFFPFFPLFPFFFFLSFHYLLFSLLSLSLSLSLFFPSIYFSSSVAARPCVPREIRLNFPPSFTPCEVTTCLATTDNRYPMEFVYPVSYEDQGIGFLKMFVGKKRPRSRVRSISCASHLSPSVYVCTSAHGRVIQEARFFNFSSFRTRSAYNLHIRETLKDFLTRMVLIYHCIRACESQENQEQTTT